MPTINATTQTERKAEAAWVYALQQNTAFDTINDGSDVDPRVAHDQTAARAVPAVTVECVGVEPATRVTEDTHEVATMRILCRTRKDTDKNKAIFHALVGAVRAVVFSANLSDWLQAPGPTDLNVHNPLYQSDQIAFADQSDTIHHATELIVRSSVSLSVAS
jgi:hypothetical protein